MLCMEQEWIRLGEIHAVCSQQVPMEQPRMMLLYGFIPRVSHLKLYNPVI